MLVSLAASFATWHFHPIRQLTQRPSRGAPAPAPIVYGTGLTHLTGSSRQMTCTAMVAMPNGSQACTEWTLLEAGQRAVQATPLPAGESCSAVQADQQTGGWTCAGPGPSGRISD